MNSLPLLLAALAASLAVALYSHVRFKLAGKPSIF